MNTENIERVDYVTGDTIIDVQIKVNKMLEENIYWRLFGSIVQDKYGTYIQTIVKYRRLK